MGRLQNLRQGVLQRLPNKQNNPAGQQDISLKKDESLKLVDFTTTDPSKQQSTDQQQRTKLRALANLGRNGVQIVLRRRSQQQDQQQQQNDPAAVDPAAADGGGPPKPCPKNTLIALHDALSNKNTKLEVIQNWVAQHPDGARACKEGNLPLHTAVTHKASVAVVQYLLEEYPEATGVRNKRYKLPIHVACECGASLDVIKLLVEKDPESLEVADYEIGSLQFQKVWIVHKCKNYSMDTKAGLPLHYACKYLASLQVIHFLITEFPDAARTKNKDGWLPVHFSCARGAKLQVVQYLMTACPSSLYERTLHYYEYPMHLAAGRMNANINVVKYIQSRHSIACTQTKPNEGLYLTYYDEACLQSAPPSVSWFLSDVCAKASKGYAYISTAEDPYN